MRKSMMDHDEAVRQKATERYLLDELDPELKEQFEEHLFDCQDCALDVRAAAMFLEQSKIALAERPAPVGSVSVPVPIKTGWLAWFRPAFAIPVLALLLVVVGYQNLVTYPHLMQAANQPQVGPWASVNVSTRGALPAVIKAHRGEGFAVLVNLPPEGFARYTADLYNPAQKLEWSGPMSAAGDDSERRQIYIPAANHQAGTYTLVVRGVTSAGESQEVGRNAIELQID
jgi:hypothetical protein